MKEVWKADRLQASRSSTVHHAAAANVIRQRAASGPGGSRSARPVPRSTASRAGHSRSMSSLFPDPWTSINAAEASSSRAQWGGGQQHCRPSSGKRVGVPFVLDDAPTTARLGGAGAGQDQPEDVKIMNMRRRRSR
ncbi:hypothetical protein ACTMU2_31615 [Cupriavidus basilensis]